MCNLCHKRYADGNNNEIPSHPGQNEWLSSRKQTINAGKDVGEKEPYILLVGM
jgi:hypothetical protein